MLVRAKESTTKSLTMVSMELNSKLSLMLKLNYMKHYAFRHQRALHTTVGLLRCCEWQLVFFACMSLNVNLHTMMYEYADDAIIAFPHEKCARCSPATHGSA